MNWCNFVLSSAEVWLQDVMVCSMQVNRLMDLIVHSLYSNKEVFLRELVRWVTVMDTIFFSYCHLFIGRPVPGQMYLVETCENAM